MIQRGTVVRFGNRGFGFVQQDCSHKMGLGNKCEEHSQLIFIHLDRMRFTEPGMRGTRFHPNPSFGPELLREPRENDRLVMDVASTRKGLVAMVWTFESIWEETDRLMKLWLPPTRFAAQA